VRLFLVSPARALRHSLAKSLDADPRIAVIGEALTSAQALVRVPAARPDVVLAGAHLTAPDSPELCRRLREASADVHVLMIGVNAPSPLVEASLRAGAAGVVPHTIDEPELLEAIRTAAAGRTVLSTNTLASILRADRAAPTDPLEGLSGLERELFYLVGDGLSNGEIAVQLRLSPGTVRNYVSRLLRKLDLRSRAQLVALAARIPGPASVPNAAPPSYPPQP